MNKLKLRFIGLIAVLLLLSACIEQKTPQEVSQLFWQAVINNDTGDVIEYSTLTDTGQYDAFSQNWHESQASWGKIVIDGDKASIETIITAPGAPHANMNKLQTFLLKQNEEWIVDYEQTREAMGTDILGNAFLQLKQFGNRFSEKLSSSTDDFNTEIQRMEKELEALSNSVGQQASEHISIYIEVLREHMKQFADTIERALNEHKDRLSKKDKRLLTRVADDLHRDSEKLTSTSLNSVTEGSKSIAKAQLQLNSVNDIDISRYKKQWSEWNEKLTKDVQNILNELSARTDTQLEKSSI